MPLWTHSDSKVGGIEGNGCSSMCGWHRLLARGVGFDPGERAGLETRNNRSFARQWLRAKIQDAHLGPLKASEFCQVHFREV